MSKSLDVGTMFLVKGEIDDLVKSPTFTIERNGFLKVSSSEDTEQTLKENNWSYIKHGNDFYILGEDAIKLKNLLTIRSKPSDSNIVVTQVGDFRRPMKDGILNTSEEKLSVAMIQQLIKNLLGPPSYPNEPLCFCVPGDPVDNNLSVIFHKTMLTSFLKSLGYEVESIPEALAIIFSERPVAEDPNDPENNAPFSGIAISCGSGMVNVCMAWKKLPLINFSVCRSGDYIDQQAAKVAGIDVSSMTRFKETKFDLRSVDYSDMRQAALDIFYQNMIEHALKNFSEKFNQLDNQIDVPLEIIVAGGTSMIPGFIDKFNSVISTLEIPFKVKGVRHAEHPLYAVSNGCLAKALSTAKKNENNENKGSNAKKPEKLKI